MDKKEKGKRMEKGNGQKENGASNPSIIYPIEAQRLDNPTEFAHVISDLTV